MLEWDRNNLREIRAHRVNWDQAQQALLNDPIPVYEQDVEGESRFVYCGQSDRGRLLALLVTERDKHIRVAAALGVLASVQERVDTLAEPANERLLSDDERAEYEALINAEDFIGNSEIKGQPAAFRSRVAIESATGTLVRTRGRNCYEYCLLPQDSCSLTHHIGHIVPRQHGGTDHNNNLALSVSPLQSSQRPEPDRHRSEFGRDCPVV